MSGRWPGVAGLDEVGDLRGYDKIMWRHSGGKDGQTTGAVTSELFEAAGVLDRVVCEHEELGDDDDPGSVVWPSTRALGQAVVDEFGDRPGTTELVRWHAQFYGLRLEVRRRPGLDLVDDVERRGMFPDAKRRWCTSDHKRSVGLNLMNDLVVELDLPKGRPARVLVVYGFRAQESPKRRDMAVFARDERAGRVGVTARCPARQVWAWSPIHHWTNEQVWQHIRASGVPYAWPYDAGMSRLSCAFCVLSSRADLATAARLRPELLGRYVRAERRTGHLFQQGRSIESVARGAGVAR